MFSNGVLILSGMACVLIVAFGADVSALIPLYAVGVFMGSRCPSSACAATTSACREPGWQHGLVINMVGCVMTGIVLVVVVVSKFTEGAWIPVVVIPLIVLLFRGIRKHYETIDSPPPMPSTRQVRRRTNTVVVLVGKITKGSLQAIAYARSLNPDRLLAVSVVSNAEEQAKINGDWERFELPVELRTLYSPYRELSRPILRLPTSSTRPTRPLPHRRRSRVHARPLVAAAAAQPERARPPHPAPARPNTVVTSVPFHVPTGATARFSTTRTGLDRGARRRAGALRSSSEKAGQPVARARAAQP